MDKLRVKAPNTADIIMEAIEFLKTLSSPCPKYDADIPPNEACPKCGYDPSKQNTDRKHGGKQDGE